MSEYSQDVVEAARIIVEENIRKRLVDKEEEVNKKIKALDWFFFASAYLELAKLGVDKFLSIEEHKSIDYYMVGSSIYNYKHGMELMLKYLLLVLDKKNIPIHNLKNLFAEFKSILNKNKKLSASEKKEAGSLLENFKVLIYEYHYLKIFRKIDKAYPVLIDLENTFLKYPENEVQISIDYGELLENTSVADVKIVNKDIATTIRLFGQFYTFLKKLNKL